jgi:seryl-tRNA synthetase
MFDILKLRSNFENTKQRLLSRKKNYPQLEKFAQIDENWRMLTTNIQKLCTERNAINQEFGQIFNDKNVNNQEVEAKKVLIKTKMQKIKDEIDELTKKQQACQQTLNEILYSLPNLPDEDVPIGKDENDNVEIRRFLEPKEFDFAVLAHYDLATKLNLADFERGAKIAGARHTVFLHDGARLMRALRNFTIDMHLKNKYTEILPPVLINSAILYGTGHLPKAQDDMYQLDSMQFLSPTEEVPLTGLYSNEILDPNILPIRLVASTLSFRKEAGSAGKDVRGIIRQHQFYNTELVSLCLPEQSDAELEVMTKNAEAILQKLKLPYRVIKLCTGDMGQAAAKTYDLEVWFPYEKKYREISSCSNCRDYQSRGSFLKYRDPQTKNTNLLHTLNGTGTSLNRL